MNTRHNILDWFGPSHGVIVIYLVLMYYAIEIGSSLFLSRSFGGLSDDVFSFGGCFLPPLDVNLFSLFIVGKPTHIV
jgi:hypothetical protein